MRILVLQFVPDIGGRSVPRFEPQLATLLSLLERREHTLALCGLARFDLHRMKQALAQALPQLIYADISSVCVDAARRTLEYIQQHEYLPIIAGGLHAAIAPAECLSLPGVHAVAIGEPDASLVTYLERVKDPAVGQVVQGVWLRDEQGTRQPELPPLVEDLSSLPLPHRELFGEADAVARTGEIAVAVGRGESRDYGHTVNEVLRRLYDGRGTWMRLRPPGHVLAEIGQLRQRYAGVRQVRILDRAFVGDRDWLDRFLTTYQRQCGLPLRCRLPADLGTAEVIAALAKGGTTAVDVEVLSSSYLIRTEIFNLDVSNEQLAVLFSALRAARMRSRAILYLGAPYESETSLEATHKLLEELKPDRVDLRPYYPFPGTRARQVCAEHGWLHPRGEEQYHHERCGSDMPACRPDLVHAHLRRMRATLDGSGAHWWQRWSVPRAVLDQVFNWRR